MRIVSAPASANDHRLMDELEKGTLVRLLLTVIDPHPPRLQVDAMQARHAVEVSRPSGRRCLSRRL